MLQSYLFCLKFSDEVTRQIEAHYVVLSDVAEKKKAKIAALKKKYGEEVFMTQKYTHLFLLELRKIQFSFLGC